MFLFQRLTEIVLTLMADELCYDVRLLRIFGVGLDVD